MLNYDLSSRVERDVKGHKNMADVWNMLENKNYSTDIPSLRGKVPEEEWRERVHLAALYRLIALWDMDEMIANHASARVPGQKDVFLINPYGYLYEEVTASCLLKVRFDGEILYQPDNDYGLNRAGFVIHSAIHQAREDAHCVIHTHTPAGMAVSCLPEGFLPLTQTAMRFGEVAYHDYQSVVVDEAEQESLIADLGRAELMVLRNHGLLVTGASTPQAFSNIYRAELACKAQLLAMSAHQTPVKPSPDVIQRTADMYKPEARRPFGVLEWPALLRKLDRIDASYKL